MPILNNTISPIVQPPPKVLPLKRFFQSVNKQEARPVRLDPYTDPNSYFKKAIDWLIKNSYDVIPPMTSEPDHEDIKNLAVVYCHIGNDELRIKASINALRRMRCANPKPGLSIMVELVQPGNNVVFEKYRGELFDIYIKREGSDRSQNIFQKEALWTIGGRYAFDKDYINKCLFIDTDTCYHDHSWAYHIDKALDKKPFVQAFSGFYYANQKDIYHQVYNSRRIMLSVPYALKYDKAHSDTGCAAGGAFACTKSFWNDVLGRQWIINSVGSGDVATWIFLLGLTNKERYHSMNTLRSAYVNGVASSLCGYADLLAFHNYHGPMKNRLYTTRSYLISKFADMPGSDVVTRKDGVLEWANTKQGNVLMDGTKLMMQLNNESMKKSTSLTTKELKAALQPVIKKHYGVITDELRIVTMYYDGIGVSKDQMVAFLQELKRKCKTPFKLYCITDNNELLNYVDDIISPKLTEYSCSDMWHVIYAFDSQYNHGETTLFIHPQASIRREFTIAPCEDNQIYMARQFLKINKTNTATWDTSLMIFKGMNKLYDHYVDASISTSITACPFGRFADPAEYISAYAFKNDYPVSDIKEYIDYRYSKQICKEYDSDIEDIILPVR